MSPFLQDAVPKQMRERFDVVMNIISPFCKDHLNGDYAAVCRKMAAALCRKRPSLLASGTVQVWACAIVYAAGRINFLFDKSQKPHLSAADLCRLMSVSQASASPKTARIMKVLNTMPLDPRWCLPGNLEDNPLAWMITGNGIVMDAREAPQKIQEEALRRELIPSIPGSEK